VVTSVGTYLQEDNSFVTEQGATGFSLALKDSASLTDDQIVDFVLTVDPSIVTLTAGLYRFKYEG